MKAIVFLSFLFLLCQHANGQAQIDLQPYEPHMEELFESWAAIQDSLARVCKDGCSASYNLKKGEIPFRIDLRNSSKAFRIDEASMSSIVKEVVHHQHNGYLAVIDSAYTGSHRDTLVVDMEVNKKGYWLKLQFNQNWHGEWIQGVYCSEGQNYEIHSYEGVAVDSLSEKEVDAMWASDEMNDIILASRINLKLISVMDCYFEKKQWPMFYDFDERNRSSNPWYIRRSSNN